ncbi:DUF5677 domain-containing protein [Thermomonas carbonis]|uniref:Uncharacterized protein n=1 Tax=Thermomonas carbonis TaxID=1463158 RepID=A0A7G9SNB8_9GAMM|nr:DUF5677 domain-containing protein [Thermomonas carbonis]QNN69343.1 hypothetical protein H9L16_11745 [Thermomonas carbonis]
MPNDIANSVKEQISLLQFICEMPIKDDPRDRLAHDSAKYASELGHSSSLLLGPENTAAFHILLRCIIESILKLAWGLRSAENAMSLERTAHNEFRRNLKSLINEGVLSLEDSDGGLSLDETVIQLAVIDSGDKAPNVREMSKALGLEHFYQVLYKMLSMHTHGTSSIVSPNPPQSKITDRAHALLGGLETVKILSGKWLALRELVDPISLQAALLPAKRP